MDLIILPGNSSLHKDWSPLVKKALLSLFDKIHIINYSHWDTAEPLVDAAKESIKLEALIAEIVKNGNEYVILAKSVGTLLTLKEVYGKKISPAKCIFLGVPLNWGYRYGFEFKPWLKEYNIPTLFIQQKADPYGTFSELAAIIKVLDVKNYTLKEVEGDNHNYADFGLLFKLVKGFIL